MEAGLTKVIRPSHEMVAKFLDSAGESLKTFRYFNSRELSVIDSHLTSLMYCYDEEPVGYGHLEKEIDKVWLGICVSEKHRGSGIGSKLMLDLIESASNAGVESIFLTVDIDNEAAVRLYEKLKFKKVESREKIYCMMLSLKGESNVY